MTALDPYSSLFEDTSDRFNELIAKPLGERAAKVAVAIRLHEGKPLAGPFTEAEAQNAVNIVMDYEKPHNNEDNRETK